MISKIQIKVIATFLTNCGADMIILFIMKVKILVLMKWSYRYPQLCWLLNLKRLSCFEHVVQSISDTCFFDSCSWSHNSKYRCPIKICNWIGHKYLIGSICDCHDSNKHITFSYIVNSHTRMILDIEVCYLDTFLFAPTSHRIWNTQLVRDD